MNTRKIYYKLLSYFIFSIFFAILYTTLCNFHFLDALYYSHVNQTGFYSNNVFRINDMTLKIIILAQLFAAFVIYIA